MSFENAKFITTYYETYFGKSNNPWGVGRTRLYQHNDLVCCMGLPMFVKDFDLSDTSDAVLTYTALGCVEIYINGKKITADALEPGWSDYLKRALYCCVDASDYVVKGKNRILAVVSTGWYSGRIAGGRYGDNTPSVKISLKSGNDEVITDSSWLACVGGRVKTADIWDGEYYNATDDSFEEMSMPGYDVDDWDEADVFDYKGEVTPFIGPKVRVRDALGLKPAKVTVYDGIEYNGSDYGKIHVCNDSASLPVRVLRGQKVVLDFSQEVVGCLKIKIKAEFGTEIKMRYAEFLNDSGLISRGNDGPEGSVYTVNLRSALGKAYYVANGEGEEEYAPAFTFFGYRYVELSANSEYELIDARAEVVGNDCPETGFIETSDELVNKLFSNTLWGQRGNYLSVPTDCPQRDERLGWTGDAQAFSVTASYNADVYGFFRKWMQDMRDSQGDNGEFGDVNPRVGCCSSDNAAGWADAGVIIPYNMYVQFGDKTIIEEHYDAMDKYICGLTRDGDFSGPIPRYGDWLAYDYCDNAFLSSAYLVHDIDLMIYMSEEIGKSEKADFYRDLRKKAYSYFVENYMSDGKLIGQTQCDKVVSLAFKLIDGDYAAQIADELVKQIKENDNRLSTGFIGTYNICPTLSLYGKDNTAYTLLQQRKEPSWLYSIDQGATTIWERWNSYTLENGFGDVGMNSFNHYAYGSVVEWMYKYMAGIRPDGAGYKKFILNPRIDTRKEAELPDGQTNITRVKAEYKSAFGLIKSRWSTENGFSYECTVPQGTTATLVLPLLCDKLSMNGQALDAQPDENGCITMQLTAGDYSFRSV